MPRRVFRHAGIALVSCALAVAPGCSHDVPDTGFDFDDSGIGNGPDAGDAGSFCLGLMELDRAQAADWDEARDYFLGVGFPRGDQELASGDPLPEPDADVERGYQIYVDVLRLVDADYSMPDAVGSFEATYPEEPDADDKYLSFIDWSDDYCTLVKPAWKSAVWRPLPMYSEARGLDR